MRKDKVEAFKLLSFRTCCNSTLSLPVAGGHKDQQYKTEENKRSEGHGKEWGEEEWRKRKSRGEGNIVRFAINSMFDSK